MMVMLEMSGRDAATSIRSSARRTSSARHRRGPPGRGAHSTVPDRSGQHRTVQFSKAQLSTVPQQNSTAPDAASRYTAEQVSTGHQAGIPDWKATTVSPLVMPEIHLRRWKLHLGPAGTQRDSSHERVLQHHSDTAPVTEVGCGSCMWGLRANTGREAQGLRTCRYTATLLTPYTAAIPS